MNPVVLVVDDDVSQARAIEQWILSEIPGVKVAVENSTHEAEEVLRRQTARHPVRCIVLDMFFTTNMTNDYAGGQTIIDHYEDYQSVPIIVVSIDPRTTNLRRPADDVPLMRFEKPSLDLEGTPLGEVQKREFHRLLIEAVRCALQIADLRAQLSEGTHGISQIKDKRIWRFAVGFVAGFTGFVAALLLGAELATHVFLAFSVVMAFHLFERVFFFKDIVDQFDGVKDQLKELFAEVRGHPGRRPKKPPK